MTPHRRHLARTVARAGTVVSAAMLMLSVVAMPGGTVTAAATGGTVQVLAGPGAPTVGAPITSGGSATKFYLKVPANASCSGDTASGGYLVQSYMVPAAVNLAGLTFDSNGPIPNGVGSQPLFAGASIYVDQNTGVATTAGGPGAIVDNPVFDFAVFGSQGPTIVPNGLYNVGIACTKGPASATQLDKYWNVQLTFVADASDKPSGIKWTTPAVVVTTTTAAGVTTTTAAGVTTTTAAGATTTTTTRVGATTTTTTVAGNATTTTFSGVTTTLLGSGAGSGGYNGPTIVSTGSSPIPIIIWAMLLLVFGRMALLLGRPMRVLPPKSQ